MEYGVPGLQAVTDLVQHGFVCAVVSVKEFEVQLNALGSAKDVANIVEDLDLIFTRLVAL